MKTIVKFSTQISKMGKDQVIVIPRALHQMTEGLKDRQLLIILEADSLQ